MSARMSSAWMAHSPHGLVVFYSAELYGRERQDDVL